jgi:hypothetical protein
MLSLRLTSRRASIEPKRSGSSSDLTIQKDKILSSHRNAKQTFLQSIHEKDKPIPSPNINSQNNENKTLSKSIKELSETKIEVRKARDVYESVSLMMRYKNRNWNCLFY